MPKIEKIPQEIKWVGFDCDETLVKTIGPHVDALEQMTFMLSDITGVPMEQIMRSVSRVFDRHNTMDYRRLIQELDCFEELYRGMENGLREQARDELVETGKRVFQRTRDNNRSDIPKVRHILKTLISSGVNCFVVSNAPIYQTLRRLKRAKFDQYFKLICGCRDEITDVFPKYIQSRQALGDFSGRYATQELKTPKPNVNLSELLRIQPEEVTANVAFVGDSYRSDMGLAHQNKCTGFYVRYAVQDPYLKARLRRFSTDRLEAQYKERREEIEQIAKNTQIYELPDPSDILKYLGINEKKAA